MQPYAGSSMHTHAQHRTYPLAELTQSCCVHITLSSSVISIPQVFLCLSQGALLHRSVLFNLALYVMPAGADIVNRTS